MAIIGFFVKWFSKPKRLISVSPVIRPYVHQKQIFYEVVEDFVIHDFLVKKGVKTDGGSIPLFLCSLLGVHPFSPAIIAQCIGHDVKYNAAIKIFQSAVKNRNKVLKNAAMEAFRDADNWFYDALRINNRRLRCKLFFLAVRLYSTIYFGFFRYYIRRK
ncbi:MAG: DUF1353 domain-containing protein [Campylobacteraceae bacterium]|jgi:hypothetical protein|nr:DUF1353 domain-containing protein [Campylobacteraceae bacterium]